MGRQEKPLGYISKGISGMHNGYCIKAGFEYDDTYGYGNVCAYRRRYRYRFENLCVCVCVCKCVCVYVNEYVNVYAFVDCACVRMCECA